jgi:TonB family protein
MRRSGVGELVMLVMLASSCDRTADHEEAPPTAPSASEVAPDPPAAAGATPSVASEPPPRGYAIVRGGAEVFAKDDGSAAIGKLPSVTPVAPSDAALVPAPASGMVVAVVGARGELVAVETLVDAKKHCAPDIGTWADLRVGLFVRKSDLLQVTTREVEHAFADGTRIIVEAGVPIGDATTGAGERVVDGGGIGLELPLPADAVGRYYEPSALSDDGALGRVPADALAYGGGRPLGPESALANDREGVKVFERAPLDDTRALVRVRSRCATVWAAIDAKVEVVPDPIFRGAASVTASAGILGLIGTSGSAGGTTWKIDAGATLTWPDGSAAGLAERVVRTAHAPRIDGARSCVVVPFDDTQASGPELCVETHELEAEVSEAGEVWGGLVGSEEAMGMGGLGLSGIGGTAPSAGWGGSIGSGSGAGATKTVKPGTAKVHGSLDKDIIRRIARARIPTMRYCYEKALVKDPSLAGKIVVSFVIGPDGRVRSADVKSSTVGDATMERCVVEAIERASFPKPVGGGVVAVTYPFVFST